jgi:hypothetical protein
MPSANDILLGLSRIASDVSEVAIGWHVALVAVAASMLAGFRPGNRVAAVALSAPLASVGVIALAFGNPFNGAVFTLLAVVLAGLASQAPRGAVTIRSGWSAVLGSVLIAFGAVYPHFLEGASWWEHLYAAPLGVIPCPTLSAVIGAALLAGGFGLRGWRLTLAGAGAFYAVFGALRLGVFIDGVLLCGAVGLLIQALEERRRPQQTPNARALGSRS